MVNFINTDYATFVHKYSNKKIVCIGVGKCFHDFLAMQKDKIFLLSRIEYLADNSPSVQGKIVQITDRDIIVHSIEAIGGRSIHISRQTHILFLTVYDGNVLGLLKQLDEIKALDGMICVYAARAITWGREGYTVPSPVCPVLPEKSKLFHIPRHIHYCWFGRKEIPELNKRCIESWKIHCPDYEITLWDESNYDLTKAPEYVRSAYRQHMYAFVTDYVRLDVIYQHGGIYLDTDVELFSSLDFLLHYRSFFCFMAYAEIATGLGFGSISGSIELWEHMRMYDHIHFLGEDGSMNLTPCPHYANEFFRWKGVEINNSLQYLDGMLFLPSSYLCPMDPVLCNDGNWNLVLLSLADHTIGMHHCDNTWKTPGERESFQIKKMELYNINYRLLEDWKKSDERKYK